MKCLVDVRSIWVLFWLLSSVVLSSYVIADDASGNDASDTDTFEINYFEINYDVTVEPETGLAHVVIKLSGDDLPSQLKLRLSDDRYKNLNSEQSLEIKGERAIWKPKAPESSLSYDFVIDEKKGKDRYDSKITDRWAILRSDKLIPPIAATLPKSLSSNASLEFHLPSDWSSAAPYDIIDSHHYALIDPGRRFIRPKGWLILGEISSRQDTFVDTNVRVAAPRGQNVRLQDSLAFLGWTLPTIKAVFPGFPSRLLIVSAGEPMWRGGLSGSFSLFMHADRPLISGNRTSSLIHEMIHVGTGIRGTRYSDWIVEGIAEYYAVEILRRTGAISERRFQGTMEELAEWGKESGNLLTGDSSGATTARAAVLMHQVDLEIRQATDNDASLDDVARGLAEQRGTVTVDGFINLAEKIAGTKLKTLAVVSNKE
ncbi:hypothetical protein [Pseudomaricurvus sp.]|uniref:hypothetical protein n=1 Tax=Pseudomaricurvus sp. TaxID=2004510 RepID=UPI003F6C851A